MRIARRIGQLSFRIDYLLEAAAVLKGDFGAHRFGMAKHHLRVQVLAWGLIVGVGGAAVSQGLQRQAALSGQGNGDANVSERSICAQYT